MLVSFSILKKDDNMSRYKIIDCGNYQTIVNVDGEYCNHCHVNRRSTADMLVRLMRSKRVPNSHYLRNSIKRVTLDNKYIEKINIKIKKDKDRQRYRNIGGRGVKR